MSAAGGNSCPSGTEKRGSGNWRVLELSRVIPAGELCNFVKLNDDEAPGDAVAVDECMDAKVRNSSCVVLRVIQRAFRWADRKQLLNCRL